VHAQAQQGPVNPRLLPDISAVGDLIADLSPDGTTQEDGTRLGMRELEIALQAAVDPTFRGDIFLGFSDAEGVHVEQAYLTATSLPWALEVRLGRFLAPVTKQNTTHRHDLHTVEYPYAVQRFFGPEGLRGTGLWASRVFAPFGFYQELIVTATERLGEAPEDLTVDEPINRRLGGLAYSTRLRNYWDLSQSSNLEVSASAITGRVEQPVVGAAAGVNAAAARQTVVGTDVTYRWRPLQQGLYQSFLLQAEVMRQANRRPDRLPDAAPGEQVLFLGPTRAFTAAYLFGRYQISRRGYVGGRVDLLQDPAFGGGQTNVVAGVYEYFPSEFSKLIAQFERVMPPGATTAVNRILFQASFALGPHRPHPF
jgi:hypothetical protein